MIEWAQAEAQARLSRVGTRWPHSRGVAEHAAWLCGQLPELDRELLVAGAYLHDVGYAPDLVDTGFHPVDGARCLLALGRDDLAAVVAWHACPGHEACRVMALEYALAELPEVVPLVGAAITWCDMHTNPNGEHVTLEHRLADIERRYGLEHLVARAIAKAETCLREACGLIDERLARVPDGPASRSGP